MDTPFFLGYPSFKNYSKCGNLLRDPQMSSAPGRKQYLKAAVSAQIASTATE